jgi:hypothetical protein
MHQRSDDVNQQNETNESNTNYQGSNHKSNATSGVMWNKSA